MQLLRKKPKPGIWLGQIIHAVKIRPRKEQYIVEMLSELYGLYSDESYNLITELCGRSIIKWDQDRRLYVIPGRF